MKTTTAPPEIAIGVDGGGSGTRVRVVHGEHFVEAIGAPSGLGLGIEQAWRNILDAVNRALATLGQGFEPARCAMALGLAGANQQRWREAFLKAAPVLGALRLENDAFTTLIGAHGGAPGVIVALGTGSVGEALHADGTRRFVGGYGFPAGDEASGAWLGLRASRHLQHALDGRAAMDGFAHALQAAVSHGEASIADAPVVDAVSLTGWLSSAGQTRYAALAPVVLAHHEHPVAAALLAQAGVDIAMMIAALDPTGWLPVALCGGLAGALTPWVAECTRQRLTPAQGDAAAGALILARQLGAQGAT